MTQQSFPFGQPTWPVEPMPQPAARPMPPPAPPVPYPAGYFPPPVVPVQRSAPVWHGPAPVPLPVDPFAVATLILACVSAVFTVIAGTEPAYNATDYAVIGAALAAVSLSCAVPGGIRTQRRLSRGGVMVWISLGLALTCLVACIATAIWAEQQMP